MRTVSGRIIAVVALCLLHRAPVEADAPALPAQKVLRYAFRVAETGFDPAQYSDLYSNTIMANIFEAPLAFEYLARPVRLKPNTAAEMPAVSADFRTFKVRIRPGIYFADDPAFGGKKRELTAQDYVYTLKRFYDPRWKSPKLYGFENEEILDLPALRQEALKPGGRFDYDRDVRGVRALDRYTFEIRLAKPSPRFVYSLADPASMGAVAREVVEAYGDKVGEHPVGTGPYRLSEWKRSSRMVLVRSPSYRGELYAEAPPAEFPALRAAAERLKGRKMPMIERVEVSIIEENQPRWLAFLGGEHDLLEEMPADFANIAIPNNQLAPNLEKMSLTMDRYKRADLVLTYFNMNDPVVGGNAPEKVALRRAVSLAYNQGEEIRLVRRGQAIIAQGPVPPETFGYDPAFKSEVGDFDPARAKALLDMYGYADRDGDGWRELPDGSPLVLEYATQPDQQSRQLNEQWKKDMARIGIRIRFAIAKWPEQLKQARAGKLMMWGYGWSAGSPDSDGFVGLAYGPNGGQSNLARTSLPDFDRLYEQQKVMPDGPERREILQQLARIMVAYMPYKLHAHRTFTDMTHPWVVGAKRNIFVRDFWKYVDIDIDRLPKK